MAGGKKTSRRKSSSSTVSSGSRKRKYDKNEKEKSAGRHRYASIPGVLIDKKPEVKSLDKETVQVFTTVMQFSLLNGVQEGSAFYNRIGRKISMKSLHWTGAIQQNTTVHTSTDQDWLRILIVYDRQTNGAFPVGNDVLLNYDDQGTAAGGPYAGLNLNNADRFVVLRDKRINLCNRILSDNLAPPSNESILGSGLINYQFDPTINEYIDLKGLEVHYRSSTNPANVGDIATGAIYLCFQMGSTAATNNYQLHVNTRLRYWDM